MNVLIGLTQLSARCGDGSCQTHEDLIAGFSAIEAEAELVQIRLKLRAAAVIGSQQERFQVADGFVQPMQIAGLIFFRVQRNAGQIPIASVAVAFDFCTRCNGFVYDLLKRAAGDVFNDLHPREQRSPVFRFLQRHNDLCLVRPTTTLAAVRRAAHVAVVYLNDAGKCVFLVSLSHRATNSV